MFKFNKIKELKKLKEKEIEKNKNNKLKQFEKIIRNKKLYDEEKIREKISNYKKFLNKKYKQTNESNNNYADPGSNHENIINLEYNNVGIELKPIFSNKREKTKKLFNILFNSNSKNLYFGNNENRRYMFKEELVNSIEKLPQNDEIYKIIKSYNPNRKQELTEVEKSKVKEYILSIFKKHYPITYSKIAAKNP